MGTTDLRYSGSFCLLFQQTSFATHDRRKYFLASIIPKPKHFRSSFAENGRLKENMEGYYKLIAGRLAKKGLISEIEADSIRPDIQVTGDALNSLVGETPESSSPTAEEQ